MPSGEGRPSGRQGLDAPRLVGREAELDQLEAWLSDVLAGRSRPLLLEGEPGIGKTSLLRAMRARAAEVGARSLAVTPIPTAVSLALAGLDAIVEPLRPQAVGLDASAIGPLEAALADPEANANPVALSGGLVALLAATAEQQPLILMIDDGQWLDRSSADVILAAFRGLGFDQVGLLVAVRRADRHAFEELQRLPIEGLSLRTAIELFTPLRIDQTVLTHCWEATGGNPLALDVILRGLDAHQRSGAHRLPDPLPVADSIAAALQHRIEAVPDETFAALVVLAADTETSPSTLGHALGRLGGVVDDLDAAEDAGIIVRARGGRPRFVHPLLRATVLTMVKPAGLRAAHRALADAHEEAGEPEARAWQLAAAASGPDDIAADALSEVAQAARRRGATAAAADGYLMAARLSSLRSDRAARLLEAGHAAWVLGRLDEATTTLAEALEEAETAAERGQVGAILGQIDLWTRGPRAARDRWLAAVGPLEHEDPGLAAKLVGNAAFTAVVSGDVNGAMDLALRAHALAPADDLAATIQATATLGYLESHAAVVGGAARLEPIVEMAEQLVDSDDPDVIGLLSLVGMCLTEAERLVEAKRFLEAVARRSRSGVTAGTALVAAILAETHWRTGDWLEATHLALNDMVDGATMPVTQAWAAAFLAHLDAAAGRAELCRQRSSTAAHGVGTTGADVVMIWTGHALGMLELGLGRWTDAARQLDRVAVLTESLGRHLPGAVWWQGDHIEALVRAGRLDDARRALDRLEREGAVGSQRWPACVAARGRAMLLSDLDGALAELASSIDLAESIPAPFEAARSRLIRGERLLASGSGEAARESLRDALEVFDRLGAVGFAERTRALLGEPFAARSTVSLTDLLTPAELRVALAVAKGATNREVASDLYVSAKTVEYHLQNIYRKLNLRSRTELAVRVSQASPD